MTGVATAFTTRRGGVSSPPFNELNLGRNTGDDPVAIQQNREGVLERLGFSLDQLALGGQVHGAKVARIETPRHLDGYDGLVTRTKGIVLGILTADCAAVLLVDEMAGVVGACHAGWRGAVARVSQATIDEMILLGADANRIRACIGPCISQEHFEVGEEVAVQFEPEFVRTNPDSGRPHVDLRGQLARQLESHGIASAHIEVTPHCTFADTERFYSYRRDGKSSGRMFALIGVPA